MKTKQKAPLSSGSTSSAAVSMGRSGSAASSVVTSAVSEVLPRPSSPRLPADEPSWSVTRSRSSMVLMRFPLCAKATDVSPVPPRVGWAFSHVEPPVVE